MNNKRFENSETSSIIQDRVRIKGTLAFAKPLYFDGHLEGDIRAVGVLTVGLNGLVKGEIYAKDIIVLGRIEGNLIVSGSCLLEENASVIGNISSSTLTLEEGAIFNGYASIVRSVEKIKDDASKTADWRTPASTNSDMEHTYS